MAILGFVWWLVTMKLPVPCMGTMTIHIGGIFTPHTIDRAFCTPQKISGVLKNCGLC